MRNVATFFDMKGKKNGLFNPDSPDWSLILNPHFSPAAAHGYGIIQKIEEMSSDRLKLGPGTLYGALNNLTSQGLIERVGAETGRRKNYQITTAGQELITLEVNRLEELIFNAKCNLSKEEEQWLTKMAAEGW